MGKTILTAIELTPDDIDRMTAGQPFTSDPRLTLVYYYSCEVDPSAFVFGNETLRGAEGVSTRIRLESVLSDCPGQTEIDECQRLAHEKESESVGI